MTCNIIWLDSNIENEEINKYIEELNSDNSGKIEKYKEIDDVIKKLLEINFEETKIVVIDSLYSEFIKKFKEVINQMKVIPKIIVFTNNKEKFIKDNKKYNDKDNKFFSNGGIATTLETIKELLKVEIDFNDLNIPDEVQLKFEYIEKKEQLVLPMFFKALIELTSNDNMKKFNNFLYVNYSAKNVQIKNLLRLIISMQYIPIELLSKYYVRLYSLDSNFHKEMNNNLGQNKIQEYLPFIKTLYEGVKLKSLPLANNKILYRGAKIANVEIDRIKNNLKNKKGGLPCSIVFSKSFLSFSKDKNIAKYFLEKDKNVNNNLSKVLFILEKDDNLEYSLLTHADIQQLSYFPNEQEVLFFPFSSFEIKEIKEKFIQDEKVYEIKLLYLGKYLKEIENDNNLIKNKIKLPDSEFKKEIINSGLIQKEKIENINTKDMHEKFKRHAKEIKENDIKSNKIIGEIFIRKEDIDKDIIIINSLDNINREYKYNFKDNYNDYLKENELKENVEIRINGEKIKFSYTHKFEKEGNHKIEYIFKKNLKHISYLFYTCVRLINLDLSHLNTIEVTHTNKMFYNCNSLKKIDLSNLNTKKVPHMNNMLFGCSFLKTVKLSSFTTENVIDMSGLFKNCSALEELNLSNFITSNVKDMSDMFNKCQSLTSLNLSNFDTKKVKNMNSMFNNCKNLKKLDITNFDTQNVENMSNMFSGCISLSNLAIKDLNTQNVKEMDGMFYGCENIEKKFFNFK